MHGIQANTYDACAIQTETVQRMADTFDAPSFVTSFKNKEAVTGKLSVYCKRDATGKPGLQNHRAQDFSCCLFCAIIVLGCNEMAACQERPSFYSGFHIKLRPSALADLSNLFRQLIILQAHQDRS